MKSTAVNAGVPAFSAPYVAAAIVFCPIGAIPYLQIVSLAMLAYCWAAENLPRNDTHTQESTEAAEHQSDDSSGREATRQWSRAFVFTLQV